MKRFEMRQDHDRIEVELRLISFHLRSLEPDTETWNRLYVAQQALAWAIEPEITASPLDTILGDRARPPMEDTHEDLEDCLVALRPPGS